MAMCPFFSRVGADGVAAALAAGGACKLAQLARACPHMIATGASPGAVFSRMSAAAAPATPGSAVAPPTPAAAQLCDPCGTAACNLPNRPPRHLSPASRVVSGANRGGWGVGGGG